MGFNLIYNQYHNELTFLERHLMDFVESVTEENSRKLVKYFLEKKGHRLRPILCFMAFQCAGGSFKDADGNKPEENEMFKSAAALELLHSASLLHDDVIDQEELRRDQKSINSLKGNKQAVLVGNIFYLHAFKLVVRPSDMKYYEKMLLTSLDMCQGEILQSEKIEEVLGLEEYLSIIEKKTAKLIELSCFFGAASADAEPPIIEKVSKMGRIIGLFYQIRDDKKDSDVHLKNENELEKICKELHREFLQIAEDLKTNYKLEVTKFLEIETMVRP